MTKTGGRIHAGMIINTCTYIIVSVIHAEQEAHTLTTYRSCSNDTLNSRHLDDDYYCAPFDND